MNELMNTPQKKQRIGHCRIEFFAVKAEIDGLAQKGWMWRHIYDLLIAEKRITMSHRTFMRYVHAKPKIRRRGETASSARGVSAEFSHNKIIDDESSLI